jgi:hypothetical protein
MTQESNSLATAKRLRARLRYAKARNDELEELLARALAAGDALDAMLRQILSGGDNS